MRKRQRYRIVFRFKASISPSVINFILVSIGEWIKAQTAHQCFIKWRNEHSVNKDYIKVGCCVFNKVTFKVYSKMNVLLVRMRRDPYSVVGKGFPSISYFCEVLWK